MQPHALAAGQPARTTFHANSLTALSVWARLLHEHGGPSPEYRKRLARCLLTSSVMFPFRLADRLIYAARIAQVPIHPSPVFILGAARSGTTLLHNLMAQDPGFGVVKTLQGMAPDSFLSAGRLLRRKANASRRPMDNVVITPDTPIDEDAAIGNQTHRSFAYRFTFPRSLRFLFLRYGTLDAMSRRELAHWERLYMNTLRKATWYAGGKRLVLKSPYNFIRIPHLLRLFPEARFVHIVRNPYTLYNSQMKMFARLTAAYQIQTISTEQLRQNVEWQYAHGMRKYMRDRNLIAADRFAEVRYEDLEQRPLEEMECIYRKLDLPGWDEASDSVAAYLKGLEGYQKNRYPEDPAVAAQVDAVWRFAVDAWQYQVPEA